MLLSNIPRCRRRNKSICVIDLSNQSACAPWPSVSRENIWRGTSVTVKICRTSRFCCFSGWLGCRRLLFIRIRCNMYFSERITKVSGFFPPHCNDVHYFGCKKFSRSRLSIAFAGRRDASAKTFLFVAGVVLVVLVKSPPASRAPRWRWERHRWMHERTGTITRSRGIVTIRRGILWWISTIHRLQCNEKFSFSLAEFVYLTINIEQIRVKRNQSSPSILFLLSPLSPFSARWLTLPSCLLFSSLLVSFFPFTNDDDRTIV